jgi:hypothetical protein
MMHKSLMGRGTPTVPSSDTPAEGESPTREDFDRLSADLTRAKNLLVRLHSKHPEARAQIEGSTGSWFIWGTDRDASHPITAAARASLKGEAP